MLPMPMCIWGLSEEEFSGGRFSGKTPALTYTNKTPIIPIITSSSMPTTIAYTKDIR